VASASSLSNETERALAAAAEASPAIEVLLLFGSAARGQLRASSDVDLYLRLARGHAFDRAEQERFAGEASRICRREIDLVVEGPSTSVILRREVAARGRPLFERTQGAVHALRVEAVRAYVELEPQLRKIGAAIRARAVRSGQEARERIARREGRDGR
jgi:predicted nucleotidyltransferase